MRGKNILVTHIIGDCPHCHSINSYGNISVTNNQLLQGCTNCTNSTSWPLTPLNKKILYLDQVFLSLTYRDNDERFVEAATKIKELTKKQLLVTPYSSIHEDETFQWRGYNEYTKEGLMEFIKSVSRGHEFNPAYAIERNQIINGFVKFIAQENNPEEVITSDAYNSTLNNWDDYFFIDVGRYIGEVELMRELRTEAVELLVRLFPEWRLSTNTFNEDVELETNAHIQIYLQEAINHAARIEAGDLSAVFNSPINSMFVFDLLRCCPSEIADEEKFRQIIDFFQSNYFSLLPYQKLSSQLFACLKDQVKRGAFQNQNRAITRLSGFFNDVKHVASYAPYCDAIFLDRAMAEMVMDNRINIESNFGSKVFSLSNWDQFIEWLDGIEAMISEQLQEDLNLVYR